MWLIVGLGNPGNKYANTRHNIGFMAIDKLHDTENFGAFKSDHHSLVAKGCIGSSECMLMKPQTFMNLSGQAVSQAMKFFKIPDNRVIVVHDDLDLPFGALKLKTAGGHGGHNGLRSIIQHIGPGFWRVRLGIGRPPVFGDATSHVLGPYTAAERDTVLEQIDSAMRAIRDFLDSTQDSKP